MVNISSFNNVLYSYKHEKRCAGIFLFLYICIFGSNYSCICVGNTYSIITTTVLDVLHCIYTLEDENIDGI